MCSRTLNFPTWSVLVRLVLTVCFLPPPFLFFFLVCRRLYLLILIFTSIKKMFSLLFFIHWKTPASLTPALFLSGFQFHFLHAYSPSSQGPCEQWSEYKTVGPTLVSWWTLCESHFMLMDLTESNSKFSLINSIYQHFQSLLLLMQVCSFFLNLIASIRI